MSRKAAKTSSRASRRPSQSTRAAARSRVSVAKPAPRRKPEPEGATLGMNAKKTTQRQGFKTQEFIVYPAHGVGQIVAIEEQEVAGARLELFVINFVKDKMTLRVP
ncbi:MAG: CarD family transcriptional regulator, partial [Xanthobacteraceae bacterium]